MRLVAARILRYNDGMKNLATALESVPRKIKVTVYLSVLAAAVLVFFGAFAVYLRGFAHADRIAAATAQEQLYLAGLLDDAYPAERTSILKPLPYPIVSADLDVHAGSAILVDAANGCVIYEKNADEVIPPASLTKLFVMYVAFQELSAGNISLDDVVPLPERSWAVNLPRDSSLMFLGQGQTVTLRELMTGLSVASGNDAAIAIAAYIAGDTATFVERMNEEARRLGLTHTHFEEPSGYSERNVTTAREFATFAQVYVTRYPEALRDFHSVREIRYPLEKNLAPWEKHKGDSAAVQQSNTNALLRTLEGCDGIKTGFIYESGFNLALTAERNGVRFISVTMRGPGAAATGRRFRELDGETIMEWAFARFADYYPAQHIAPWYTVAVTGATTHFVRLVPAWTNALTVPHLAGLTALDDAAAVTATVQVPRFLSDVVRVGDVYGSISYRLGDRELARVPLVADRNAERAGFWRRLYGGMAKRFL